MPITVHDPDYLKKKRLPKDEGSQIMGIITICLPGIVGIIMATIVISQESCAKSIQTQSERLFRFILKEN